MRALTRGEQELSSRIAQSEARGPAELRSIRFDKKLNKNNAQFHKVIFIFFVFAASTRASPRGGRGQRDGGGSGQRPKTGEEWDPRRAAHLHVTVGVPVAAGAVQ